MAVYVIRYSLVTLMIEDEIKHEIVATSVVTSSKPSESHHADCQIHGCFSHEKSVHLLYLDFFPEL